MLHTRFLPFHWVSYAATGEHALSLCLHPKLTPCYFFYLEICSTFQIWCRMIQCIFEWYDIYLPWISKILWIFIWGAQDWFSCLTREIQATRRCNVGYWGSGALASSWVDSPASDQCEQIGQYVKRAFLNGWVLWANQLDLSE